MKSENKEYELETENIRSQIKYLASLNGLTLNELKMRINEKYQKSDSVRNLSKKLKENTLRIPELGEVANILGYKIILRKEN
jgi:hypothetical protein